jgi:CRISPR-associated protein Cmr6
MPNPIPFLTIDNSNNLTFNFNIAIKENSLIKSFGEVIEPFIKAENLSPDSKVLDVAQFWLTHALTNHGIGAKTAVGYGYMEETK